ncbi:MAG: hypothetical protein EOP87_16900, partial [Verrucomicrobiaceae bacterium]
SGVMEGAITAAFNAAGAGGVEGIASGSARELFRHTMRQSVSSTWLAGAKEFTRGTLGEVGEEVLIEALDNAFVQMNLNPEMTIGEFFKSLHDTALVTAFTSAPSSTVHGANAVRDVRGMGSGDMQTDAGGGRKSPSDMPGNPYRNADGTLPTQPYHRSATDPDLAEKEAEFNGILAGSIEQSDAAYNAIPETRGGKVVGTDLAREVSPRYRTPEDRARYTGITTGTASQYAKDRLWREIHDRRERRSILFTAGGPASGKSTVVNHKLIEEHDVIHDGTMRDLNWAKQNLEAADSKGWKVSVVWVGRPMKLTAIGVVERAITEGRPFGLADLPDAHYTAQKTTLALAKHFEGNPAMDFQFYYNAGASRHVPAAELTLEQIDTGGAFSYDNTHGTERTGMVGAKEGGDPQSGLERFRAASRADIVAVFRDAVEGHITVEGKRPSRELLVQLAGRDPELQQILKDSGR